MTPGTIRGSIVGERVAWVRQMLDGLRQLPLHSIESFRQDPRNPAAAESYLRRAIEALLDLGRHILAKGFGVAAAESKDIADGLVKAGVLADEDGSVLRKMAGYRNRMVHFYHEVSTEELYRLCSERSSDIDRLCGALTVWLKRTPERMDPDI